MRKPTFLIAAAASLATLLAIPAEAGPRHHRHSNGAAFGAALGAGIFLGALAASSAQAGAPVYVEEAPPPPPRRYPVYGPIRDRGAEASYALDACRDGLLDAARAYGAYDAEIGDIYSVRETEYGYRVRAEVTMDYPHTSRTSTVTCETEDGVLISAYSEY